MLRCYHLYIADSEAAVELEAIVLSTRLLNDLRHICADPIYQSSHLESYHNVQIHFAQKCYGYSFFGMLGR